MRRSLVVALMLTFAAKAMAIDPGNESDRTQVDRQGGDTIGDAVPITLPYNGTGTTSGYNDDYDVECPYVHSISPDVVYTATPTADGLWDLDTFGSNYVTKLYVYDVNLDLIACNDGWGDDEEDGRAYISRVPLVGGEQYFIVIDGYGGAYGDYCIDISEFEPYELECPSSAELEGEPPLVNDYEDDWNGGCNWNPAHPTFQPITMSVFCGVTGWYIYQGASRYHDTDWFTVTMPDEGLLEITGDAEEYTGIAVVDAHDCYSPFVLQSANIGFGTEWQLVVTGEPGSTVWLWVRSGGIAGGPYGGGIRGLGDRTVVVFVARLVPVHVQLLAAPQLGRGRHREPQLDRSEGVV